MTTYITAICRLLILISLSSGIALANQIDDQAHYEQELNKKVDALKTNLNQYSLLTVNVTGAPKSINQYHLEDKIEQAVKNGNYESLVTTLKAIPLTISQHPTESTVLLVHPYQNRNSAYEIAQAILGENPEDLIQALESPDESLDQHVYVEGAHGETVLHLAILNLDVATVKALLEAGAGPDVTATTWRITPMARAVANNNFEIVELLLDAGADINNQLVLPLNKPTLLSLAAATGNIELLKKLLDRGADTDVGDLYGWTPLMEAVHAQDLPAVKLLLPHSNPNINSTLEITENSIEKGFDRTYPLANALYIAEQYTSPVGEQIRSALLSSIDERGDSIESLLPRLQALRNTTKVATGEGRIKDAIESLGTGLDLLAGQELSGASPGELINHTINMVVEKHELDVINGGNLDDAGRTLADQLFAIGSQSRKWHDMLDVFYVAQSDNPQSQLQLWQRTHGNPSRQGWNFELLADWIESFEDATTRDRLYDTLDFFELN